MSNKILKLIEELEKEMYTEEPDAFETYSEINMDKEFQYNIDKEMYNHKILLDRLYNYLRRFNWCKNLTIDVENGISFSVPRKADLLFAFHQWYGKSKLIKKLKVSQYSDSDGTLKVEIK